MQIYKTGILAALLLAGCASTSVTGGGSGRTDGLGSDLRVFLDDSCLPPEQAGARSLGPLGFGATTLGTIAIGAGKIAFQSFGRFLEEAGQPNIDTASGVTSALFYSADPSDEGYGDLGRDIRCVHVVRNGFEPGPAVSPAGKPYAHLELLSEPSLYALIRLDPAEDRSAFFRGQLLHVQANRFERAGGELSRDVTISLGFGSPLDPSGSNFAAGLVQLPGLERRRTVDAAGAKGLLTAWMNTPPRPDGDERLAFNLYVDVVESKRGNPFLADIGRLLQSDPVVASVERDIAEVVIDDRSRRRQEAQYIYAQRTEENRLRRNLEDLLITLEAVETDEFVDNDTRLSAIRAVEDSIEDVEYQRAAEGWQTPGIDALLARATGLINSVAAQAEAANQPD